MLETLSFRPSTASIVMTGAIGAFATAMILRPPPVTAATYGVIEGVFGILTPLLAAILGAKAGHLHRGRVRWGWWLMAAGWLSWAVGQVIWTYIDTVHGRLPFPSAADPAYLGFVPLVFAGIVVLTLPSTGGARLRWVLDMLIVSFAVATLFREFIVQEMLALSGLPTLKIALMLAYPLGDVLLLVAVATAIYSNLRRRDSAVLLVLMAGIALFLTADISFSHDIADGSYVSGSPSAVGWFFGFVLMARASYLQMRQPRTSTMLEPDRDWQFGWKQMLAPVLLVPVLIVLGSTTPNLWSFVLGLGFGLCVLIRRVVGIQDGIKLNRSLVAMHDEVARSHAEVEKQSWQLAELLKLEEDRARTDGLTGVRNRAAMDEFLRSIDQGPRDTTTAIVLVDVDNLKSINDRFGHLAGDRLLRGVARALSSGGSVVGRFGGDEFLVVLPGAGDAEALLYLTRVHRLIDGMDLAVESREVVAIRVSAGHAVFPTDGASTSLLVDIANQRMYVQKRAKALRATESLQPDAAA